MAIGKCYDALKRPKLAERYFRKALSVPARTLSAKSRAHATYNLANSLLDQARLDEAITLFEQLTTDHVSIRSSAKKTLMFAQSRLKIVNGRR
ncbi:tetratricopeptide repeat protein [Massilia violaceinigra]|uniref:Tetratricopeptide repeat protein n=1 Tax=Massilia violaceinigra TaxID=2045208 RepID=A0ABY4ALF2_9BURK|nr:tetratricopeptide repeat protein [Massilia violaceinigra]UOD33428.1 tetratricopeptide repeat protein [Massilia violaceinigra]